MKHARKILGTQEQVKRLLTDVLDVPAGPAGAHLSDDACLGYAMETLHHDEVEHIDRHLASCDACLIKMERLVEGSDVWRGEARKRRRAAAALVSSLLWLQVTGTIIFAAVRLARTRRQKVHFKAQATPRIEILERWTREDVVCMLLEERAEGFVFAVDTKNPSYDHALMRFALVDTTTEAECVTGLLVLHPDPYNPGHYVAAARLDGDAVLPEHCQPRLDRVRLDPARSPDPEVLLAAVAVAHEDADRQAWHEWARQEVTAERLGQEVGEAIGQYVVRSQ